MPSTSEIGSVKSCEVSGQVNVVTFDPRVLRKIRDISPKKDSTGLLKWNVGIEFGPEEQCPHGIPYQQEEFTEDEYVTLSTYCFECDERSLDSVLYECMETVQMDIENGLCTSENPSISFRPIYDTCRGEIILWNLLPQHLKDFIKAKPKHGSIAQSVFEVQLKSLGPPRPGEYWTIGLWRPIWIKFQGQHFFVHFSYNGLVGWFWVNTLSIQGCNYVAKMIVSNKPKAYVSFVAPVREYGVDPEEILTTTSCLIVDNHYLRSLVRGKGIKMSVKLTHIDEVFQKAMSKKTKMRN